MKRIVSLLLFVLAFSVANAQTDSIVRFTLTAKKVNDSIYSLQAKASITKGWYLYGINSSVEGLQTIQFNFNNENISALKTVSFSSSPKKIMDKIFEKQVDVFTDSITATQSILIKKVIPSSVKVIVTASLAKGSEFHQSEDTVTVALEGGKESVGTIKLSSININQPLNTCGAKSSTDNKNFITVFLLGLLGGFIALLTPCVFPMIPVTVSFFTKRSSNRKQAIKNGSLYGFFIFLIYVLASLPFHILGNVQPEIFNNISTSPWLNIIFFITKIKFSLM